MGIITTIKNIFSKADFEDEHTLDEEKELEQNLILDIYEQTKDDYHRIQNLSLVRELERQSNYKIVFHLIPKSQNYKNVRSYIEYTFKSWQKWQDLRVLFFTKTDNKCSCCERVFTKENGGELHELWSFDDIRKAQKLEQLIPLCNECHSIAHITRYKNNNEKLNALMDLYCLYNEIENNKGYTDLEFAESLRANRNKINYSLDLSLLNNYGFSIEENFNCHSQEFNSFILNEFNRETEE
ncbi:hypothetical protein [Serratia nevei]|uniref:hypothetical protein n=1 Tax=Serratia nevei TaxID=2703794 RepID=UPI003F7D2592